MNFGMALAPWLLGLLADSTSTNVAITTGIGISLVAAAINAPLMWRKSMGRPAPKIPPSRRILDGEDEALVTKALDGEYIHPEVLFELNRRRGLDHKQAIVGRVRPYAEDKEALPDLYRHAEEAFRFRRALQDRVLNAIADPENAMTADQVCEFLNETLGGDPQVKEEATRDLGAWVGDYLKGNGYNPHVHSIMIKLMVMKAFPSITQDEVVTPENVERVLLRSRRVMNQYLELEELRHTSLPVILSGAGAQNFYS